MRLRRFLSSSKGKARLTHPIQKLGNPAYKLEPSKFQQREFPRVVFEKLHFHGQRAGRNPRIPQDWEEDACLQ
jgi:hypothetical protein